MSTTPEITRTVAIAAGGNTGNPADTIVSAFALLSQSPLLRSTQSSPLYRTAPVRVHPDGPDPGGAYINAALLAQTSAAPHDILTLLHNVERRFGRERDAEAPHGAPRPLDLDLLLVGDLTVDTPALTLPHPRMHHRAFVLAPLADLAPNLVVPRTGKSVSQLLTDLGPLSPLTVQRITP